MKTALITGITGQDGYYLSKLLMKKGYKVFGLYRRTAAEPFGRIIELKKEIEFVDGDVTDIASIIQAINKVKPDELYNLAAQSFVPASWTQPDSVNS